tara:strand:- start:244 stop:729 length:486 start_codon:yes stop_codon:yes gene_type:complete
MNIKIIDNFLKTDEFNNLKNIFLSNSFDWCFDSYINTKEDKDKFQFTHFFFEHTVVYSNHLHLLKPILNKLNCKALIRAKLNLTTQTDKSIIHGYHNDFDNNKTAIMYFNTTNGKTYFKDYNSVDCIENRLIKFDSNLKHSGSSCTDKLRRVALNINYYEF